MNRNEAIIIVDITEIEELEAKIAPDDSGSVICGLD